MVLGTLNPPRHFTDWPASASGLLAWAFDPVWISTNSTVMVTAGRTMFTRVPVHRPMLVTNVVLHIITAGSGLTAGNCRASLYNSAGTLLAGTADQSTTWNSTGTKIMALTSTQLAVPPYVFVGFYHNGTTAPAPARTLISLQGNNMNLATPSLRTGQGATTGLTSTPAATLGAQTINSTLFWAAIS